MKFKITDGLNKIAIGLSEAGSYFYFKKPLVATWRESLGTIINQYLSLLPYEEDYRNEVRNNILSSLDTDYTHKPDALVALLNPLFKLFQNGNYDIKFYHSSDESYFTYPAIENG